jgi:hypothetical protein
VQAVLGKISGGDGGADCASVVLVGLKSEDAEDLRAGGEQDLGMAG